MSQVSRLRSGARRARRQVLSDASGRLARGETVDFEQLNKQLAVLSASASLRSAPGRALHVAWPVVLAAMIVATLWTLRVSHPDIVLRVKASRVIASVREPIHEPELGRFGGAASLQVAGFDALESSSGVADDHPRGDGSALRIEGGTTSGRLRWLAPKTARPGEPRPTLVVAGRRDSAMLEIRNRAAGVALVAEGATRMSLSRATGQTVDGNAAFDVRRSDGGGALRIEFTAAAAPQPLPPQAAQPLEIEASVVRLQLLEEGFDELGRAIPATSLQEGTLVVVDTGATEAIAHGAALELGDVDGVLSIALEADGVSASFTGRASSLELTSHGRRRDLRPSVIDRVTSDRGIAQLWSALVFVVGVIFSLRHALTQSEPRA